MLGPEFSLTIFSDKFCLSGPEDMTVFCYNRYNRLMECALLITFFIANDFVSVFTALVGLEPTSPCFEQRMHVFFLEVCLTTDS